MVFQRIYSVSNIPFIIAQQLPSIFSVAIPSPINTHSRHDTRFNIYPLVVLYKNPHIANPSLFQIL